MSQPSPRKTSATKAVSAEHRCPHCGYCPHCGRSNFSPYRPWYPWPYIPPVYPIWYVEPNLTGTATIPNNSFTVTMTGDTALSGTTAGMLGCG